MADKIVRDRPAWFADYRWLSQEMLKFIERGDYDMFLSLLDQREAVLDSYLACSGQWQPPAAQLAEIAAWERTIGEYVQKYLNRGRQAEAAARAYRGFARSGGHLLESTV